ncbi:hypothetical protein O181_039319, partial [Austropuccinia psidii MF-1]|nr:hypothetical protein [Austropuccinia psidii MF-1]
FDIDNTLYSKHCGVNEEMNKKIHDFFCTLDLPMDEADELHSRYYKEYGLALRGLIRLHSVDPMDYDQKCDQAIPLEEILTPDPVLRQLLLDVDRSKARVWCLTNAYKVHALRVLNIMNLSDLIEGVVSCDYTNPDFHCKPEKEFFQEAIVRSLGQDPTIENLESIDPSTHLIVDDAFINILGASGLGFASAVLFDEDSNVAPPLSPEGIKFERITKLEDLRYLPIWKDCILSTKN